MPIYTYRCNDCGHEFEQRQRMSDDPLTECPVCEGGIRRIVNAVGVVFKGSGFYITDNRNGSNGAVTSTTKKKDKEESSATDTKTKKTAETSP